MPKPTQKTQSSRVFRLKITWPDGKVEHSSVAGDTASAAIEALPASYDSASSIQILGEERR